tara:strand:+ start:271 stop:606 length:336 start_codon:yes stop_codon:yes gene_type:complete
MNLFQNEYGMKTKIIKDGANTIATDSRISSRGFHTHRSLISSPAKDRMMPVSKTDKSKLVRNYLTKNIDVRPILKEFRKSLDLKFPDPSKQVEETREIKSGSQVRDIKTGS